MKVVDKLGKEFFSTDMNKIVNDSLIGNDTLKNIYLKGEKNNEELIILNNLLLEMNKNGNKEPVADKEEIELEKLKKQKNEQTMIEFQLKLSDLENVLIELKNQVDRNIIGSIEEEEDDKARELSSLNLRDYIKNVYLNVRSVGEKVINLSKI